MAYRRILTSLTRQSPTFFFLTPPKFIPSLQTLISHYSKISPFNFPQLHPFSSHSKNPNSTPNRIDPQNVINDEDYDDDDDDEDEEDYTSAEEEDEVEGNVGKANVIEPACFEKRSYYLKEKIQEAADIGYKVVGPLVPGDHVFNRFALAFAVVQVGSHQFKVSNGDCIYVERLKYCEVNDKLILNKVLMVGSPTQTIIGRPILPEAAVHAVVEEHALDAKVIIFKKKRRKNYRRTKGHRQELTRLRITDIQGIEKPEAPSAGKTVKAPAKKAEKVAVAA